MIVDLYFGNYNENVKDSKKIFMIFWRVFRCGTNHPSIAQRGVSCSKVDLGEPESSNKTINILFWKQGLRFCLVVLRVSLMKNYWLLIKRCIS